LRQDAAPELDSCDAPASPTETAPGVRRALRTDMAKLAGVFLAAVFFMQVLGPVIVLSILSPAFRAAISSHSAATITAAMNDAMVKNFALANFIVVVLAASLYLFLRGRRLVTTDITTTVPVGNRWALLGKTPVVMLGAAGVLGLVAALIKVATGYSIGGTENKLIGTMDMSVLGLLFIILIGPFIEEVVFRGAIMRFLMPYGVNFAIVTQALLFALYHMNFWQSLGAFVFGLVLGYVAARFSLKWSYALHVLNNGLNMLTTTTAAVAIVITIAFWLCAVGAIGLIVRDRVSGKPLITEGRSTIVAHPFKVAWTQPFFLIVVAVLFIIGLVINVVVGH